MNYIKNYTKSRLAYHYLVECGFQLGGNVKSTFLRNTSTAYGRKNKNYVVKVSLTSVQLKKGVKLTSRYLKKKSPLYFVHSHFGFKILMNQLINKTNILYLTLTKYIKFKRNKSKLNRAFVKPLKKVYFISKWKPGFLTNRFSFFKSRKLKKKRTRFPRYGFVNDYKINFINVKEFKYAKVPFSSMVNLNVSNCRHGFFDIPGNGSSYDTVFFNLISVISSGIFGVLQGLKHYSSEIYKIIAKSPKEPVNWLLYAAYGISLV